MNLLDRSINKRLLETSVNEQIILQKAFFSLSFGRWACKQKDNRVPFDME